MAEALDTVQACPPLTLVEEARLRELRLKEMMRLAVDISKAKHDFIRRQAKAHAERTGCSVDEATGVIERLCTGVLLPNVVLPFDDPELLGQTVADVLADPIRFEGATMADPLEGVGYGRSKAKVMLRPDCTPWIHSFAHGRTTYELRLDHRAVDSALNRARPDEVVGLFVRLALRAELDKGEIEQLRELVHRISGTGKRALDAMLKQAHKERDATEAKARREHQSAQRNDPRPQIFVPARDSEFLPVMATLNEVLGNSWYIEPPTRDVENFATRIMARRGSKLHQLTSSGSNADETEESRLPPPELPLLIRHTEASLTEEIERHIEFVAMTKVGPKAVHLPGPFVRHYLQRDDGKLPTLRSVATMPLVLPDRTLQSGHGLWREQDIMMRVPPELEKLLPKPEECTPSTVSAAMRYLAHNWLSDVATDFTGRATVIAMALTILQRAILDQRPAFFLTAGQRGSGKTTLIQMISTATIGTCAAAAPWSTSDDERRKAMLAYLSMGLPLLVWDNIAAGSQLTCPVIEAVLTTETYTDRVLGVTDIRTVPATTVMGFTGNNINATGDLTSRRAEIRLSADRPDPENREFRHPDPIDWTHRNRGQILRAMYTILLGNPRLGQPHGPSDTRFKSWWHLVGSAIEFATDTMLEEEGAFVAGLKPDCPTMEISYKKIFQTSDGVDEQYLSLVAVLTTMRNRWPTGCTAAEVARYASQADEGAIAFKAELETAACKAIKVTTGKILSRRLHTVLDRVIDVGGERLKLRLFGDHQGGTFRVDTIDRKIA